MPSEPRVREPTNSLRDAPKSPASPVVAGLFPYGRTNGSLSRCVTGPGREPWPGKLATRGSSSPLTQQKASHYRTSAPASRCQIQRPLLPKRAPRVADTQPSKCGTSLASSEQTLTSGKPERMSVRWAIEVALKGQPLPGEVAFNGHLSPMGCTSTAMLGILGKYLSGGNPNIAAVLRGVVYPGLKLIGVNALEDPRQLGQATVLTTRGLPSKRPVPNGSSNALAFSRRLAPGVKSRQPDHLVR